MHRVCYVEKVKTEGMNTFLYSVDDLFVPAHTDS